MKSLILATILVGLITVPALGHLTGNPDRLPDLSTWPADSNRTTHQYWTFSSGNVKASGSGYNSKPEEVDNPVPQGVFSVIEAAPGTLKYFGNSSDGYFTGDNIKVAIKLNNYEGGAYKIMWFDVGIGYGDELRVDTVAARDGSPILYHWELLAPPVNSAADFGIQIWPNPAWEEIHFRVLGIGARLDYIHVDTACIPEPATVLLLGIGGLILRKFN
jgi:hypothetical protein